MRKILRYIRKTFLWLVAIVLLLTFTAIGVIILGSQGYINKNLSAYVNEKTNGLYTLNFESIELDFKNKGFTITELQLTPNKEKAQQIQQNNPHGVFYSLSTPELQIHQFHPIQIYKERKIHLDKISIVKPEFSLSGTFGIDNDSIKPFDYAMVEIKQLFNSYLEEIMVDEIEFIDANYQFYNMVGDSSNFSNAEKVSIGISEFRTDSILLEKSSHPFETEDIFVRMINFKNEMSDSIHFLEIDSLEYSFNKEVLEARGTQLYPKYINKNKSSYSIKAPSFTLKSKSISTIYSSDSLLVEYCKFENPEIIFYQKQNPGKLSIEDINNFDLYDLVKNEFKAINVDTFLLNNARLEIYRQEEDSSFQQKFEDIDIQLLNFTLDAASNRNPEKLFFANEIEMQIGGYLLNLNDQVHQFRADSISVSTSTNSISVKGLQIKPNPESSLNSRVKLNIACNNLNLNKVDLKNTYHHRTLVCNNVEIEAPMAQLDYFAKAKNKPEKKEPKLLFELVSDYLKGVYSNVIEIKDGSLKIQNYRGKRVSGFFETNFTFSLTDFSLDSTSLINQKLFYASNFDLEFSNYNMKLVDNLHKLSVKNILISSNESKAIIDSLSLKPIVYKVDEELIKRYNKSETYSLFVPKISILNADLHAAFFEKKLNINSLKFYNPEIFFENFAYLKKGKQKKELSELYQLIFNYVDNISIQNASVPDGEITWINHPEKSKSTKLNNKFDAELINFNLNREELNKKKLLFSEYINLSLRDQLFKLSDNVHYLQADEINLSTQKSSIEFTNALFYPDITSKEYKLKPTTFQITIPSLQLKGVDIPKAYYSRIVDVKDILASNPKFEVYSQKGKTKPLDIKEFSIPLPPEINALKVDNIQLNNGEVVTYQLEGNNALQTSSFKLTLQSEDITLSTTKPFRTKDIHANLSDFNLILKDRSHEINIDNIQYEKELKTIDFKKLKVLPIKSMKPKKQFDFEVPTIYFKGFDTDLAYNQNKYKFSSIEVDHPSFNVNLNDTIKSGGLKKLEELDFYPYVEPYLNQLSIGYLSLNNANIDFQAIAKGLKHENINIDIKGIEVGENQPQGRLLNAEDIEFKTYNIKRISKNKRYNYIIDTLVYSSSKQVLGLHNIHINPRYSKKEFARLAQTQTDVINSEIAYIKLSNMDMDRWLSEKIIDANLLTIGPSVSTIYRNKRFPFDEKQVPPWPQDLISTLPYPFVVDSVSMLPSELSYSELLDISDEPATISFSRLNAAFGQISNIPSYISQKPNFSVKASTIINNKALLDATFNFDFSAKNYQHTVSGNLQPIPMALFNDFTEKAALVTVKEGNLKRLNFEMELDGQMANGLIWFAYDDLKIAVIDYENGRVKKEGFASLMANSLLVNSKNPRGKTLEPETISYTRDPHRSVLSYWWKSIFNGAKKAMGIKEKKK